jgi:GNAT superfamily N-acetyltransferase
MNWHVRIATERDEAAMERLIETTVRRSLARFYSEAQLNVALGPVFGLDRQLVRDGTYFVIEDNGQLLACGGWSKRVAAYGGDRARLASDDELNPQQDAARIRAFFVHPERERCGLGRALLDASEQAIRRAGFQRIELVATLAGEPLYARFGYRVRERYDAPLPDGQTIAVVRMSKEVA